MKKFLVWILTTCLLIFTFSACITKDGEYHHPDFKTKYMVEEHIQRITARTEERFQEEIENGLIVDIFVDIVYAFYDDDPEYFLVEIEYKEELSVDEEIRLDKDDMYPYRWETTTDENGEAVTKCVYPERFIHAIGYTVNDHYMLGLRYGRDFIRGLSPYTVCGYKSEKKYYGSCVLGVKQGEDILGIHRACVYVDEEWIVPKDQYKELMKKNQKMFTQAY